MLKMLKVNHKKQPAVNIMRKRRNIFRNCQFIDLKLQKTYPAIISGIVIHSSIVSTVLDVSNSALNRADCPVNITSRISSQSNAAKK